MANLFGPRIHQYKTGRPLGPYTPQMVHEAAREMLSWLTDERESHGLPAAGLQLTLGQMHQFLLYWYDYRSQNPWPTNLEQLQQECFNQLEMCTPHPYRLTREMTDFEARRLWIYHTNPDQYNTTVSFWYKYGGHGATSADQRLSIMLKKLVRPTVANQVVEPCPDDDWDLISDLKSHTVEQVMSRPSIKQRTPDWYAIRPSTLGASTKAKHTPQTFWGIGWYDFQYGTKREYSFQPVEGTWLANLQDKVGIDKVAGAGENLNVFGATTAVGRGRMYEPVVAQDTTTMSSTPILEVGMFVDPVYPFNAVSPDGIAEVAQEAVSIEFKCPDSDKYATEQPLEKYACQMLSSAYINQVSVLPFVTSHYAECGKEAANDSNNITRTRLLLKRANLDLDERYLYPPPELNTFKKQERWATDQQKLDRGWCIHYYRQMKWRTHVLHMTLTSRWIYQHYQLLIDELWFYYIMEARARPDQIQTLKKTRTKPPGGGKAGRCLL